jgi:hypothetical protein
MTNRLKCGTHGEREARFVCDHLFVSQREAVPLRLTLLRAASRTGRADAGDLVRGL